MTTINTLTKLINEKNNQRTTIEANIRQPQNDAIKTNTSKLKELFNFDNVEISIEEKTVHFFICDKEIFYMDFHREPYINYYSTITRDAFELNRLILLGKAAEIFMKNKHILVNMFNHEVLDLGLWEEYKTISTEVRELEKLLEKLKQEQAISDALCGIVFDECSVLNTTNTRILVKQLQILKMNKTTYKIKYVGTAENVGEVNIKHEDLFNIMSKPYKVN